VSYQLNKTNGDLLTDLVDGQIDNSSTNLVLVGRNYSGYGEYFNENFIKLLENFANTAAPSNPLQGQTWWDNTEQRLKVYDGTQWKASGGPFVQDDQPQMVAGDLWIDNLKNQMYAFDGTDLFLVGPQYTTAQGKSGFEIGSLLDEQSRSRTVVYLYAANTLLAVISYLDFTPIYSQRILGLVTDANPDGRIFTGFNIIDKDNFKYRGIAESANALVTGAGVVRTADSFLPSNANGETVGTLKILNNGGLTIGASQANVQKVVGPRFYIENQLNDDDISLRVSSSSYGSITVDALYIDASEGRVGIFTTERLPEYTLDVEGDLRVTGNLLVEGETTSIDVSTLRVEDKNIEIAKTSDGDILDAVDADGAGLTLETNDDGSKTWTWINVQDSWTSNVHINLSDDTKTYKIGGQPKLTDTSLTNITDATDLVRISSTLEYLNIDDININGATITNSAIALSPLTFTSSTGLNITAGGDIAIQDSQKITGLADPTDNQDAATKFYVDDQIATETIVFSLDITGLLDPNPIGTSDGPINDVAAILQSLYPAQGQNNGKIARIHATSYAGASATLAAADINAAINYSRIDVDSNGTQNESVVQDFTFSNIDGDVTLIPSRYTLIFESNGSSWSHVSTAAYT
jgi:hypothetical protein